jgi:phytoene dehydrogenase-like protein
MNVVVIGSGLSRLTAAAYLAQTGYQVAVFEQY